LKKIKICAFVCALAVGLTVTGCADTTWALKDGDITIPTGVYNYYLLGGASTVQALASSANAASSGSTVSDIWSQTVSKTNAVTWTMNSALESCKELVAIEKLCASRKITLSSTEKTSASSTASTSYGSYTSLFTKNDISETSIQRIAKDMYLKQALFTSYYGTNGDKAVSEGDIEDYYTKNFAHIKQIFIAKFNTSTYAALTGDDLTAAEKKAKEAYAAASADVKNFSTYVTKYNQDTGMTSNPDGYIFSKKTAVDSNHNYDTKFTDLAFSLKVGAVGMSESDMGWFIEYRVETDPKASTFTDSMKETVLSEMKNDEFEKIITDQVAKETFQQNEKTMNYYNPKKLDLTTS